jgi:hypothetical protein
VPRREARPASARRGRDHGGDQPGDDGKRACHSVILPEGPGAYQSRRRISS